MALLANWKIFKLHIISIPHKLFQNMEGEGTFVNSLSEASTTLILKHSKATARKENYEPHSLTDIEI